MSWTTAVGFLRSGWGATLLQMCILTSAVTSVLLLSGCERQVAIPSFKTATPAESAPAIFYTNYIVRDAPWSIHVVRLNRADRGLEFYSSHARKGALGLSTLTEQIKAVRPDAGTPVAGVNGDFFVREKDYAGDPRGLQIQEGEVLSAPVGGTAFWIDEQGQPHAANVNSSFKVTWPNGTTTPLGLNEERRGDGTAVLYTPAIGASTHATSGTELVLEKDGSTSWLPLAIGATYNAKVREIRNSSNTRLSEDTMVLSVSPGLWQGLSDVKSGAILKISTETSPALRNVKAAISGGPLLVHEGKRQTWGPPPGEILQPYATRSMNERHPRTAIGWDEQFFYLVEVDGRQRNLSVGMTLKELADFAIGLGCKEVMNFDGGGSAMIWCNGRIVNSPCDKFERRVANTLLVLKKTDRSAGVTAARDHAGAEAPQ